MSVSLPSGSPPSSPESLYQRHSIPIPSNEGAEEEKQPPVFTTEQRIELLTSAYEARRYGDAKEHLDYLIEKKSLNYDILVTLMRATHKNGDFIELKSIFQIATTSDSLNKINVKNKFVIRLFRGLGKELGHEREASEIVEKTRENQSREKQASKSVENRRENQRENRKTTPHSRPNSNPRSSRVKKEKHNTGGDPLKERIIELFPKSNARHPKNPMPAGYASMEQIRHGINRCKSLTDAVSFLEEKRLKITASILLQLIICAGTTGSFELAAYLFDEGKVAGLVHPKPHYIAFIQCAYVSQSYERAAEELENLINTGFEIHPDLIINLMMTASKNGDFKEVEKLFEKAEGLGIVNDLLCGTFLFCAEQLKHPEVLKRGVDFLENKDIRLSGSYLSTLIKLAISHGDPKILKDLERIGKIRGVFDLRHQAWVDKEMRMMQIIKSREQTRENQRQKQEQDSKTTSTTRSSNRQANTQSAKPVSSDIPQPARSREAIYQMIDACDRLETAIDLTAGLELDGAIFDKLIQCAARTGTFEQIADLWAQAEIRGLEVQDSSRMALVHSAYAARQYTYAREHLIYLKEKKSLPPAELTLLMESASKNGDFKQLQELLCLGEKTAIVTEFHENALLLHRLRLKNDAVFYGGVDFLENKEIPLDATDLYELMEFFAKQSHFPLVKKLFEIGKKREILTNPHRTLYLFYGREHDHPEVLKEGTDFLANCDQLDAKQLNELWSFASDARAFEALKGLMESAKAKNLVTDSLRKKFLFEALDLRHLEVINDGVSFLADEDIVLFDIQVQRLMLAAYKCKNFEVLKNLFEIGTTRKFINPSGEDAIFFFGCAEKLGHGEEARQVIGKKARERREMEQRQSQLDLARRKKEQAGAGAVNTPQLKRAPAGIAEQRPEKRARH